MFGTVVNVIAIIAGGLLGLVLKKGIKSSTMESVTKAQGVAVFIIGLNGVITNMISVGENGRLTENGGLILLISLVLGIFVGELLRIDERINTLGKRIESRMNSDGFAKGFVSAVLIFCVGSMGVMGSINDGLSGDSSLLYVKSILDFITAMVLSSTMGIGVIFSSIPLFVYQGGISLFASNIKSVLDASPDIIIQFSAVGYAIIMCIGINFIAGNKIKTANLLPAMLVPVVYNLLLLL